MRVPRVLLLMSVAVPAALTLGCQSVVKSSVLRDTTVANGHADFPNKVIVGDVLSVAVLPAAAGGQALPWQDATVKVERLVHSLVDGNPVHVRFQGAAGGGTGWPKLAAGQRLELALHLDTLSGAAGRAFVITSGDDVRAVDDSPATGAALLAQLTAADRHGELASALQALADQRLALEGGTRAQALGPSPATGVPSAATIVARLAFGAGTGAMGQLYIGFLAGLGGATQLQFTTRTGPPEMLTGDADTAALLGALRQDRTRGWELTLAGNTLADRGFALSSALRAPVVGPAAGDGSSAFVLDLGYRSADGTEQHLLVTYAVAPDASAPTLQRVVRTGAAY